MHSNRHDSIVSGPVHTLRSRLHTQLDPMAWNGSGLSPANRIIVTLILFASILAILETEKTVREPSDSLFNLIELLLASVFIIEYMARWYASGEDPRFAGPNGRIKYVFSIWSIIDLLAIVPMLVTMGSANTLLFRIFKMLRLLRLARLGQFSDAWRAISEALHSRRFELGLSFGIAMLLLLFSSILLYIAEADHQPESFGSIPRTLWWSVATLTTVGYGDVTPLTPLGRIFAGLTAIAGIGLIAMPTGILAAAFSDVIQKRAKTEQPDQ